MCNKYTRISKISKMENNFIILSLSEVVDVALLYVLKIIVGGGDRVNYITT